MANRDARIAFGLTVLCVITRIYAIPASLWEWDDIDFARSLHEFNLTLHSPHPPGFPVFVGMGRIAFALLRDEHSALVAVNIFFTSMLGAILYFLYLEFFEHRAVSFAAAILGCFAPSLWVHSGIARSDGPTLILGLLSLLLVLKGRRSRWAFWAGCAVLAVGMGIRVSVVPLAGPVLAIVAFSYLRRGDWRLLLSCALTGLAIILAWYVPMVIDTGWEVYQREVGRTASYVWRSDTIFAQQATLELRFVSFFLKIWGEEWIAQTIYVLSALGLILLGVRRRAGLFWLCLSFVPYIIFTLVMNTPMGAVVYSMPYIPFFTGLAAYGLVMPFRWVEGERGWLVSSLRHVGVLLTVALALGFASWSQPLIRILRQQASPPILAMKDLQLRLDKSRDVLLFDKLFLPHVTFYLNDKVARPLRPGTVEEGNLINPVPHSGKTLAITPEPFPSKDPDLHFRWPPGRAQRRLQTLSIGRYFDVYVTDVTDASRILYASGWYQPEGSGKNSWRWAKSRSSVALIAVAERMDLHFRAQVARHPGSVKPATVVLRLDGREIGRFSPDSGAIDERFSVNADPQRVWSTLAIESDQSVIPRQIGSSNDDRELAVQCLELEWLPSPNAPRMHRTPEQFLGEGWYGIETATTLVQRWTKTRAVVHLPPIEGDADLSITTMSPFKAPVKVQIAGRIVEKMRVNEDQASVVYRVPASVHGQRAVDLELTSERMTFPGDSRELGLPVIYLSWMPARD